MLQSISEKKKIFIIPSIVCQLVFHGVIQLLLELVIHYFIVELFISTGKPCYFLSSLTPVNLWGGF